MDFLVANIGDLIALSLLVGEAALEIVIGPGAGWTAAVMSALAGQPEKGEQALIGHRRVARAEAFRPGLNPLVDAVLDRGIGVCAPIDPAVLVQVLEKSHEIAGQFLDRLHPPRPARKSSAS